MYISFDKDHLVVKLPNPKQALPHPNNTKEWQMFSSKDEKINKQYFLLQLKSYTKLKLEQRKADFDHY